MLFELIFLGLFLLGWLFCAFLPWLALSVATRGDAGIGMLPLCLFTGVVAALAVPLLIHDGWTGVWLSFVVAILAPAALLAIRRWTAAAAFVPRSASPAHPAEPRPSGSGSVSEPRLSRSGWDRAEGINVDATPPTPNPVEGRK